MNMQLMMRALLMGTDCSLEGARRKYPALFTEVKGMCIFVVESDIVILRRWNTGKAVIPSHHFLTWLHVTEGVDVEGELRSVQATYGLDIFRLNARLVAAMNSAGNDKERQGERKDLGIGY